VPDHFNELQLIENQQYVNSSDGNQGHEHMKKAGKNYRLGLPAV